MLVPLNHFLHRRLVSRLLQNPFEKKQNIKARKYCCFEYLLYLLTEKNHFGSRFTKSKKPNVNVNVQNPVEKNPLLLLSLENATFHLYFHVSDSGIRFSSLIRRFTCRTSIRSRPTVETWRVRVHQHGPCVPGPDPGSHLPARPLRRAFRRG